MNRNVNFGVLTVGMIVGLLAGAVLWNGRAARAEGQSSATWGLSAINDEGDITVFALAPDGRLFKINPHVVHTEGGGRNNSQFGIEQAEVSVRDLNKVIEKEKKEK